jgi:ribonuclease E
MATLPEAETGDQAEQAPAPARQEAAVKSIAPPKQVPVARPVVAAEPQARSGLIERIVGWFKKQVDEAPAAEIAPAQPVAAITRSERPNERRERSNERKPGQRRARGEGRNGDARQSEPRQSEPRQSESRHNEARSSDPAKPARPPRQPKPRPEVEAAPHAVEPVETPRENGSEEKREPRNRRGRGNRRPREARPAGTANTPMAVIEIAGFRAIVEVARPPKAAAIPQPPAQQQDLQLETAAVAGTPAVTASPTAILAGMAAGAPSLQQVETQGIAASSSETDEPGRPRRRRPAAKSADTGPASLMQVETTAPAAHVADTPAPAAPHPTRRRERPQLPNTQEPLVQVETQQNP